MGLSRRELIQTGAGTGTLLLGAKLAYADLQRKAHRAAAPAEITAWVRIAADNTITLIASQSEMGQGSTTTLAAVLADELYVPFERVKVEFGVFAPAYRDPVYNWMFTGNSQSTSSFYDVMRTMGAAAREMLLRAASEHLRSDPSTLRLANGRITHTPTKKSISYGSVAADAARLPVPAKPTPRSDSRLVGRPQKRWDIPSKTDGSAQFGIDVKLPGMLLAAVRCAPRIGATLQHYDAAAIKKKPGVVAVVEVPHGLAVVADTWWQAHSALKDAELTFSDSGSTLTTGDGMAPIFAEKMASGDFFSHKASGDAAKTIASAPDPLKLEATYQLPFQAHATMEPMNCTAHFRGNRCEVWAPTQGVEISQNVVAQVTGLPLDKIVIHRTLIGGGFGRRLLADFVKQAVIVSMTVKRPVKLIWSREEDFTHDAYRTAMLHRISAAIDDKANVIALAHRVVSPSHMLYVWPREAFPGMKDWSEPAAPPENYDGMAVEGLTEIPYEIPAQSVEQHRLALDVPVSVWRTTGHGPNNFVLESFVDELAALVKADPLAFRKRLLAKNPRALKLLDVVADKSGWANPPADGSARGIALAKCFGGYIAMVAELGVTSGKIRIHRIVCAVDCGRTIDPGIAESNILGGIVWGLSGMKTSVAFQNGAATKTNFDAFEPIRLIETPRCEVHFVDSGEKLGGTGELGPVPVHPAVCNAIFAATGTRIRSLPLPSSALSLA